MESFGLKSKAACLSTPGIFGGLSKASTPWDKRPL